MSLLSLSARAVGMLAELPLYERDSPDIQNTVDAFARELDRIQDAIDTIVANFWPQTAEAYLSQHEALVGVTVNPPDKTLEQRRLTVLAYLRTLKAGGSGSEWVEGMNALLGSGWSYVEAGNQITVTVPFGNEIDAPTGLSGTPSTTGGTLSAATRYYVVTAITQWGETTISNRVTTTTTGTTSRVVLDWADVTGATGYRVYRGTTSGAERLLTEVVTSTYTDTGALTPDPSKPWPVTNTSRPPRTYEAEAFARTITPAHVDLVFGYGQGFIVGESIIGEEPL